MFLAGDIGGTKTHLALYDEELNKPVKEQKFSSQNYASLLDILSDFIEEKDKITRACFGIAGPIKEGLCKTTNLPWIIETKSIKKKLSINAVSLLNDLEANAWGIKTLTEKDFFCLNKTGSSEKAHKALISAGTGLGEAGLFFDGKDHIPLACEGGHCDFAPNSEIELLLWRYLKDKFGHVSVERVLSGPGLVNIYRFFSEQTEISKGSSNKLDQISAQTVSEKALNNECPNCVKALDLFISIYGAEAGNLALKFLALGGLYIGGGIAPKILQKMKNNIFMSSFINKGRFSALLESIDVKVILNPHTALLGAGFFAKNYL